ncbi:MAG TPA: ribonuclease E activity regulator RraA [Baekduia sp.]|nr:ribonuclease E activity regulator RraA [Baekduia sp.]
MSPSTCELLDERPELGCCILPLRSFGARRAFSGVIATVSCLEDNVVLRSALDEPGEGRVLVVDGHGSPNVALMGDAMAARAAAAGWAGLVINGAIRDADALGAIELGILALGAVPRRAGKAGIGAAGVPVSFGAVTFEPDGTVWADADGVVVAPPGA